MNFETDDTNYADIENIESIEGIIKIGNSGAPSISDLSPNSNWKRFPQSSYNCCYGLPYQDHNYGAPPPPTPPPSPGNTAIVTKKNSFEIALKSLKPNKTVPERKTRSLPRKQTAIKRRNNNNNQKPVVVKVRPAADESETVIVTSDQPESTGLVVSSGDYSDSVTRCICSFTHDDGYMICCDQCQVWQHIDCMGIDRGDIPEEYSCEQCMPRKVYKARARLIQKKKRNEILRSSSEDENTNSTKSQNPMKIAAKIFETKLGTQQRNRKATSPIKNGASLSNNIKKKAIGTDIATQHGDKRVNKARGGTTTVSVDGDAEESLSSLPYETAVDNQYSTDIQESLKAYRPNGTYQLESLLGELDIPRCVLRLLVNGSRGLEVEDDVRPDQALVEFKGKVMLRQQFEQENNFIKRPQPFVLFYDKWDDLRICVDATSFGNEARFVRRSCTPNSEVRHVIENGQVHLVVFSSQEILSGSEITIPFDIDYKSCEYLVECACIKANCPVRRSARKVRKCISHAGGDHRGTLRVQSRAALKQPHTSVKRAVHEELKVEIPENHCAKQQQQPLSASLQSTDQPASICTKSPGTEHTGAEETRRLSREDRKIEAYMKAFEIMEKREERRKEALQRISEKKESPNPPSERTAAPTKPSPTQPTPAKPTPAKPTPAKPAFRLAARRRRNRSGPATRRRSASSGSGSGSAPIGNQLMSESEHEEADGGSVNGPSSVTGRPSTIAEDCSTSPTTRIPAPAEVGSTHTGTVLSATTSSAGFRFPKTKKQILNEWYHEKGMDKVNAVKPLTVAVSQSDSIDFVKTNTSPGASWAHLRRNSMTNTPQSTHSETTQHTPLLASRKLDISMGSAKKRWLKQAMEEDSNQSSASTPLMSPTNDHSPPTSTAGNSNAHVTARNDTPLSPNDSVTSNSALAFVTPLKKRRIARESLSSDSQPISPDGSRTTLTPSMLPHQPLLPPVVSPRPVDQSSTSTQPLSSPIKVEATAANSNTWLTPASNATEQMCVNVGPSDVDETVPETLGIISPLKDMDSRSNEIPATAHEVKHDGPVLMSPLRKYKLTQHQMNVACVPMDTAPATILSPREPRTLGDLMLSASPLQAKAEFTAELSATAKQVSPPQCVSEPPPIAGGPSTPVGGSPHLTNPAADLPLLDCPGPANCATTEKRYLSYLSPAIRSINLGEHNELTRSMSLVEDTRHHWNDTEDCGVDPVRTPPEQEHCGGKEYAPVTPPLKKKVSLLEYRKRMQTHTPKSDSSTSTSAPTTPLQLFTDTAAPKQLKPITLPSLPLFDGSTIGDAGSSDVLRPPISLDERLKREFGFGSKELAKPERESDDENRDTPPPPPPLFPPATDGSSHESTDESGNSCNPFVTTPLLSTKPTAIETNGYIDIKADLEAFSSQESVQPPPSPPIRAVGSGTKKATFPLKQGSLGAVMLGQPVTAALSSGGSTSSSGGSRDLSGSRQITSMNLPKKYR